MEATRKRRLAKRRSSPRPSGRAATARLIESEAQKLAHVGTWQWDAVRNEVTWSEELYRIYRLGRGEFDGTYEAFLRRVHPEDRARTREVIAQAFREGKPFAYDHRIVRADGAVRMLQTRGDVVRDGRGAVARLVGCCMDVTEQWETQRALDESLAVLRATLESTEDGIFVADLRGKVVLLNRRALELWKVPEALAARGDLQLMVDYVTEQLVDPDAFRAREAELLAKPALVGLDRIVFKDGRIFERYTQPQRLRGLIVGRVCSFRDVTQRERAFAALRTLAAELEGRVQARTEELRRRTDELARSNADLDAFASTASHDLSAPLRKIGAFAQLLESRAAGKLSSEELAFLQKIQKNAATMAVLIADLLTLSRVTRESLPIEDVHLDAVLAEVVSEAEGTLTETGGRVEAESLPRVRGRASLWKRLLQNLIANALKFRSPQRRPLVTIRSQPQPDGGFILSVQDNGIGFEPQYAKQIFQPFRRLHTASEYEGSGLGLAICARIVQRFGGEIWADSEPGAGATFSVRVPAPAVSLAAP